MTINYIMEAQNNCINSMDMKKQDEVVNAIRKMLSAESEQQRNKICLLIQIQVENCIPTIHLNDINQYRSKNLNKIGWPQSHVQDINSESSQSNSTYQKQIKSYLADYSEHYRSNSTISDNQSQSLIHPRDSNYGSQNKTNPSVIEENQDRIVQTFLQQNMKSFSRVISNSNRFQQIIHKIPKITQTSPLSKRYTAEETKYKKQIQEYIVQIQILEQQKQSCKKLLKAQQIAIRDKSQQCEDYRTRLQRVKGYLSQQKEIVKIKTAQNQQLKLQLQLKKIEK